MTEEKKSNVFYVTHSGELLFWLVIILIVVAVSSIFYTKNIQDDNDYTIFMNDVDGLIVGSPVRMMGIEVGHITKIKPTNEEVYVKFIITDEAVTIPQGTVATVEFSGMAGSKSLELYLPDKTTYIDKSVPLLAVNPPKRLHDAAGLLNDMFEKLGSIIYTSSSFVEKLNYLDLPSGGNPENINKFIKYADNLVDDSNKRAEDMNKKLDKFKKGSNNGAD